MFRVGARPKLVVPTVLAVCMLSCGGGGTGGTGGSGGRGSGGSGGAAATGGGGGSGGAGNPYDELACSARDKPDCTTPSVYACMWTGEFCFPDCPVHAAKAECEADPTCIWTGDVCTLPV
jgi:hypothetical protein